MACILSFSSLVGNWLANAELCLSVILVALMKFHDAIFVSSKRDCSIQSNQVLCMAQMNSILNESCFCKRFLEHFLSMPKICFT